MMDGSKAGSEMRRAVRPSQDNNWQSVGHRHEMREILMYEVGSCEGLLGNIGHAGNRCNCELL
jgi:hypothetical protein